MAKASKNVKNESANVATSGKDVAKIKELGKRPTREEARQYLANLAWVEFRGRPNWQYVVGDYVANGGELSRAILAATGFVDENDMLIETSDVSAFASKVPSGQRRVTLQNVKDLRGEMQAGHWAFIGGRGATLGADWTSLDNVHRAIAALDYATDGDILTHHPVPVLLTRCVDTAESAELFGKIDGVGRQRNGGDWYSIATGDSANANVAATICQLLHGRLYGAGGTYSQGAGRMLPDLIARFQAYLIDACTFVASITEMAGTKKDVAGFVEPRKICSLAQLGVVIVLCDMNDANVAGVGPEGLPFGGRYETWDNWFATSKAAKVVTTPTVEDFPEAPAFSEKLTEAEKNFLPETGGEIGKIGPWGTLARLFAYRVTLGVQERELGGVIQAFFDRTQKKGFCYAEPKRDTAFADLLATFLVFAGLWEAPTAWTTPDAQAIGRVAGKGASKKDKQAAETGGMPRIGGYDLRAFDRAQLEATDESAE